MLNLKTSRICCKWLSSPVGCVNVLISFIIWTSIKMLSWKKISIMKCIAENRKIVIRPVTSVWKKKILNLYRKLNPCVQLTNALQRLYNEQQRTVCCATLLLGSYTGQEEWKLERHKGISIGVDILWKDGKRLLIKIFNNSQSLYRK